MTTYLNLFLHFSHTRLSWAFEGGFVDHLHTLRSTSGETLIWNLETFFTNNDYESCIKYCGATLSECKVKFPTTFLLQLTPLLYEISRTEFCLPFFGVYVQRKAPSFVRLFTGLLVTLLKKIHPLSFLFPSFCPIIWDVGLITWGSIRSKLVTTSSIWKFWLKFHT